MDIEKLIKKYIIIKNTERYTEVDVQQLQEFNTNLGCTCAGEIFLNISLPQEIKEAIILKELLINEGYTGYILARRIIKNWEFKRYITIKTHELVERKLKEKLRDYNINTNIRVNDYSFIGYYFMLYKLLYGDQKTFKMLRKCYGNLLEPPKTV